MNYKSVLKARQISYTQTIVLALMILLSFCLSAQERPPYFDGPYIFQQEDSLQIKWIEGGYPQDTVIARADATVFQRDSLPVVDLQKLDFPEAPSSTYTGVEKIMVISDVHGQYELMRQLLLAGGVINAQNEWNLGEGHLVVIGDNLDRGDEVLPILWLFFHLEQQAIAQGGRVHLLLGNHELMVLNGDIRYLHRKYNYTAGALRTPYKDLFAEGSILGDWIAQHQVAVSINRNLFLHAGLSPEVLKLQLSLDQMNRLFRDKILRQPEDSIEADPTLSLLYGEDGPVWYRGYFAEKPLAKGKFKKQLKGYDQQKMIVGHTSQESIQFRYGGKLIVVDCSIKLGQDGQILLIEDDASYIIDRDGEQLLLTRTKENPTTSIQDIMMASVSRPKLTLNTDFVQLVRRKREKEYQEAQISLQADGLEHDFTGRIRARGNIRKEVCNLPPLMVDLQKSDLDALGYVRNDKLKLVIPCKDWKVGQTNLYKEFLVYELYRQISDHGLQTKLIDIEVDGPKRNYELTGFLIETEQDYSHRTGAMALQWGRVTASAVDRERFVRMMFFQYMIANCDWSVSNKHNLELVKYPDNMRTEFVAYDFDYAGFVGNTYAVPANILPISSVHQRYFFSYKTTDEEIDAAIAYFLEQEEAIYAICAAADYLDEETREKCQEYLRPFFDLLRNPRKFKRTIGRA